MTVFTRFPVMHHVRKSDKTRIVFLFMERLQNANKFIELIIMERNMKSLLLIKPLTFDTSRAGQLQQQRKTTNNPC